MYAIIETGGKQYRVEKGDIIDVELLASSDKSIEFANVLFINNGTQIKLGSPFLGQSVVKAELIQEVKGTKVVSYKYKQRKGYRRKVGHRQRYHRVKITDIVG